MMHKIGLYINPKLIQYQNLLGRKLRKEEGCVLLATSPYNTYKTYLKLPKSHFLCIQQCKKRRSCFLGQPLPKITFVNLIFLLIRHLFFSMQIEIE